MPIPVGSRLGAYEILSPLGAGGMGEVYRAMDPRLHREVAIKVISEGRSLDADSRRRFARSDAEAVLKRLEELSERRFVSAYNVAIIRGALGEKDAAFAALEKALDERAYQMAHVRVEPILDSLRSDPRFPSFVTRVGSGP